VRTGYIIDRFPKFYRVLFETKDITLAMKEIEDEYNVLFSEGALYSAFLNHTKVKMEKDPMYRPNAQLLEIHKRKFLLSDLPENSGRFQTPFDEVIDLLPPAANEE
jgi:hypothetical protein